MNMNNRIQFQDDVCDCGLSNEPLSPIEMQVLADTFITFFKELERIYGKHIPFISYLGNFEQGMIVGAQTDRATARVFMNIIKRDLEAEPAQPDLASLMVGTRLQ